MNLPLIKKNSQSFIWAPVETARAEIASQTPAEIIVAPAARPRPHARGTARTGKVCTHRRVEKSVYREFALDGLPKAPVIIPF